MNENKYMNQQGLDYNTERPAMIMPEYGREIQKMVDHAVTLPTKEERQCCAETIVKLMIAKSIQPVNDENSRQAIWDHLYIMSYQQLDIDWPYDVSNAEKITGKPQPIAMVPHNEHVRVRHYGHLVEKLFEKLKTMPEGEELDELIRLTAHQMKRNLMLWGHGSAEDDRVFSDMRTYTDGRIIIDSSNFKFDPIIISPEEAAGNRKKRKK